MERWMSQLKKERKDQSETIRSALTKMKVKTIIFDDCVNYETFVIVDHNRKPPPGKVWARSLYKDNIKCLPLNTRIQNIF